MIYRRSSKTQRDPDLGMVAGARARVVAMILGSVPDVQFLVFRLLSE